MDDEELTPEQKFAMDDPADKVHFDLAHGRDREDIFADMVRFGWSKRAAESMIDRAADDLGLEDESLQSRHQQADAAMQLEQESPEGRRKLVQRAMRQMIAGTMLILLGAVLGVLAVLLEMAGGSHVFLPTGILIAVGAIVAARGYTRWHDLRTEEANSEEDA